MRILNGALPLLWAVCVFVLCGVCFFLCSLLSSFPPPPPRAPPCTAASLSDLYPGPKASRYFYNTCSLTVSNGKICCRSRSDNAALWHGGRGEQGDSVTVGHSRSLCCHHHILLGALSRCHLVVFSLWQVIFSRLPCAPLVATPFWLLLTVSLGIAGCCLLLAACCWRYVNRYHLLSLSCAQVFCERNSNRVNFWPPPKIKGGK